VFFGKTFSGQNTKTFLLSSQYKTDTWGVDDGLPQNSVCAILQTRDGFLWLGTYGGLARFDGVNFKIYNHGNSPSMLSDRILCLCEDRDGTLWIGTENGGVMAFRDGKFSAFTTNDGLADNMVNNIVQDSIGNIWFSHKQNTLSRYLHNKFEIFSLQNSDSSNYFITLSPRGTLLFITAKKILSYDNAAFHFYHSLSLDDELRLRTPLLWDKKGNCWITTDSDLYKFPGGDMRKPYKQGTAFTSNYFSTMFIDSKDNLWITTKKDFCRFDSTSFVSFSGVDNILRNRVSAFYEDREENLWIGTHTGGLVRLRKIPFTVFTSPEAGGINNITAITALQRGAIVYGLNCGGFGIIANGNINAIHSLLAMQNNCVWSLLENSQKEFFIGTWGGGLYRCQLDERMEPARIVHVNNITSEIILALYEDRQKTMWCGTYNDGVFHIVNDSVVHYTASSGFAGNDVRAILESKNGDMWFGTGNGLYKLNREKFLRYTIADGLSDNAIRALYEDTNGVLWIGTYGGGLNRFAHEKFFPFTTKEGMYDNLISHILEDDYGYFWFGCNRGIFRVAKKELNEMASGKRTTVSSVVFGKDHGLLNVETNGGFQPNALKTSDGKMYFPTVNGVVSINPADVKLNTTIIPVVIENIRVDQKEIPISKNLSVGPEQHTIAISYTAPSFIEAKKVKFKYKLVGYDEQWIDADTRREAYYTGLPGGEYKFIVIAANSDGIWNTVGASFVLTVIPPFWKTWWFIVLVSGSFISVALLWYRSRHTYFQRAQLERELFSQRLLESHEEERKRIASELHDSIGQDLLVIKNRIYLAMDEQSAPQQAQKQLEIISDTTSKTLKELREIAHNLHPYELERLGLTEALKDMIATIQDTSAIRFIFEIDELEKIFNSEEETHVFRIVQEILNNILKHSEATEVFLTFQRRNSFVHLSVRDNGKGFDYQNALQQKTNTHGIGLSGLQERVRLLNGTFDLQSDFGKGTHIQISLPIRQHQ
jgi:signal transduction histidine kinase/ligand-binding sensor domain-containing protein